MEGEDLDLVLSKMIGLNKLCLFSALYHWNLGNVMGTRSMFFSNTFSVEANEYSIFKCINGFDDFVKVKGFDLFYTDPYRTICDLVAYGIDELTILEALDDFVNMYSVDRLREYAVKYNVSERLNSLLGEIEDGSYYLNYC